MNTTIHILGIAPYRFLPAINGGHKAIEQLYRHMGKYAPTAVVSTKSNSENKAIHFKLIKLFGSNPLRYINVLYYYKLKAIIRDRAITHLIMEHPYMGWLGVLLQKNTNIRLVIHAHNIEAMRFRTIKKWWWRLLWYYEKWVFNNADTVCFITGADKDYSINQYHLPQEKGMVITFGTELDSAPSISTKQTARNAIQQLHNIPSSHKIILFTGSFSYAPNLQALQHLLYTIHPLLTQQTAVDYTLLICGIKIPADIVKADIKGVVVAGFVEDIDLYFAAADVFACPVTGGGGIKTKLVEALAYDNTCVSYRDSATGIAEDVCKGKLLIAEDNQAGQFVQLLLKALQTNAHIGAAFYKQYSAQGIAEHLLQRLQNTLP